MRRYSDIQGASTDRDASRCPKGGIRNNVAVFVREDSGVREGERARQRCGGAWAIPAGRRDVITRSHGVWSSLLVYHSIAILRVSVASSPRLHLSIARCTNHSITTLF